VQGDDSKVTICHKRRCANDLIAYQQCNQSALDMVVFRKGLFVVFEQTNRSAFMCLQRYQTKLNPCLQTG